MSDTPLFFRWRRGGQVFGVPLLGGSRSMGAGLLSALAALARDGIERLIEIGQAVTKLEGPERDRVMLQLLLLLGLRKVPGLLMAICFPGLIAKMTCRSIW